MRFQSGSASLFMLLRRGGLNPQAFSRPGLFSKPPCTRDCKSLRTSATEGKRRHDAAPNSRLGLCAKLPCTRGREFPQTSAAEGKRPTRERQASSSRSRLRELFAGSTRQATCARTLGRKLAGANYAIGRGIMPHGGAPRCCASPGCGSRDRESAQRRKQEAACRPPAAAG